MNLDGDVPKNINHTRRSMFVKGIHNEPPKYLMKNGRVCSFNRTPSITEYKSRNDNLRIENTNVTSAQETFSKNGAFIQDINNLYSKMNFAFPNIDGAKTPNFASKSSNAASLLH